jgi:acetophenone carboxylase
VLLVPKINVTSEYRKGQINLGEVWKAGYPSEKETAYTPFIDNGDFEIYSRKLELICFEARQILSKMGTTQMLQSGDVIVGIYTAAGDLSCAVVGTHLHVVCAQIIIKYIISKYQDEPSVGIKDGDLFFVNEALLGGVHNPDILMIMPIFHDGELIAWTAVAVHEGDTGSIDPGGMTPRARTRYDEGLHISPIKVGENFRLKKDIVDFLENSVRNPRQMTIDLKARATSCMRVRKRILEEVVETKGNHFFIGLLRKNIDVAAEAARNKIASLNDGTYRTVIFLDIGIPKSLLKITVTVYKKGDEITFDFNGTSPENREGPWNTFAHGIIAGSAVYLFQYFLFNLPNCSGSMVPFKYVIPEGTLINASEDAAVSVGIITVGHVVFYGIHHAMSKMLFSSPYRELACAGWVIPAPPWLYGGLDQWGFPTAGLCADQLNATGLGGRPDMDGPDAAGFNFCPSGIFPDAEFQELQLPFLYLFRNRYMSDNHGFGKYRGGSGVMFAVSPHNVDSLFFASAQGGQKIPCNSGLFGGYATITPPGIQITASNLRTLLANSDEGIPYDVHELLGEKRIEGHYTLESLMRLFRQINSGDLFLMPSPGGASYGDVLERDPELVMADLRKNITTPWVAQNVYKVVYDPVTLRVDREATDRARRAERENRRKRGKPYHEFVKEWSQRKPPEEILTLYGSWPNP